MMKYTARFIFFPVRVVHAHIRRVHPILCTMYTRARREVPYGMLHCSICPSFLYIIHHSFILIPCICSSCPTRFIFVRWYLPCNHETFTQCRFNVGHWNNIGSTTRFCCVACVAGGIFCTCARRCASISIDTVMSTALTLTWQPLSVSICNMDIFPFWSSTNYVAYCKNKDYVSLK